MIIKQDLISKDRYGIKTPYKMEPKGICVHNTANDAPAKNEIAYMERNNNQVSFHVAVDDVEAIQAIPFNRNAWHAGDGGNGEGNRNYIAIEICYSLSGSNKFDKAEKNAIKVIAKLLNDYGWGIDKVKKHQDFSNKYCPHRTLDLGWDRFLNMVKEELYGSNSSEKEQPKKQESKKHKSTYTGNSIVDYLNSIGKNSSFSNRKKLAQEYGIRNYKGTASQNTQLLKLMRDTESTPSKPKKSTLNYKGNSIVDYLKSINVDSSFNSRKKLAEQNGIRNYKGTAGQNAELLKRLRG